MSSFDDYRNIWVIALLDKSEPPVGLLKLLGYARLLGDNSGAWVEVLAIGKNVTEDVGKDLIQYGADNVHLVSDQNIEVYNIEQVAKIIEKAVNEKKPRFLLFTDNPYNRALAGYLAGKFNSVAITECIKIDIDPYDQYLRGTKIVFKGQLLAIVEAKGGYPQIATVKPLLYSLPFKDEFRSGRVNKLEVNLGELQLKTNTIKVERAQPREPHNWHSKVVVAIGEEVGDSSLYEKAKQVFEKFEIYVGGTKTAVDRKIVPRDRLLGPLGKIIRPDLLALFGSPVSIEKLYGYHKKSHVLAVAKDNKYPAIQESTYYAIGDAKELLERVLKELEKLDK